MKRLALGGGLALLLAIACVRNPATGKNELMLVSESQEIQMGAQYDSEVVTSIGLYPDPALQSYVADLGKKERHELPYPFQRTECDVQRRGRLRLECQ